MSIDEKDLSPDAGMQYVAVDLIQKAHDKGLIQGMIPRNLLDKEERKILRDVLRNESGLHSYTDLQIEATIVFILKTYQEWGFVFAYNIDELMRWYRGEG